jgi:tRNA G18 (ribose-2'-O)-methylase SpoU
MRHFDMRECQRPACRLRFPAAAGNEFGQVCPLCQGPVVVAARHAAGRERRGVPPAQKNGPVEALLDNLRSAYNVGAIFRTADGAGGSHLYLGGITPHPGHPRVSKTALGAEQAVPWSAHLNGLNAARTLQESGRRLWALEAGPGGESLFEVEPGAAAQIVLVVGNEIAGIDPEILGPCDRIVSLPMMGRKHSLNVEVAFGVAAYAFLHGSRERAGESAA